MKLKRSLSKGEAEEVESEGTWAISYGDMITLLLSFFVIFFSTDFDKAKNEEMKTQVIHELSTIDFNETTILKESATAKNAKSDVSKIKDHINSEKAVIEVINSNNNIIIKFSGVSFFNSGKVDITEDGKKVLTAFSEKFLPYAGLYKLSVKGFTDQRKVMRRNDRFKDNLELSALRAVSAMRELQKNGIPLTNLDIAGHGEMMKIQKIIEDADTITDDQKNALSRTIVMIIKPEKEESFL